MNVQTVFSRLHGRAKASSIFCGIIAGLIWGIVLFAAIGLSAAGAMGGALFGRIDDIGRDSVMGGYQMMGDLFLSALAGFAILALVAGIIILSVPAVLFTIGCVNGFSKAKKEQAAVQTPGSVIDFRMFKADAVYKVIVSGITILLAARVRFNHLISSVIDLSDVHSFKMLHKKAGAAFAGVGGALLFFSPVIVIFVLSVMNLSEIGKWRKWLDAVRAQNERQMHQ